MTPPEIEARQPTATRPRWRKLLLAGLCLLTVAVFVVVMVVPFITFTYTGKFAHYISTSTFDNDGANLSTAIPVVQAFAARKANVGALASMSSTDRP